METDQTNPTKEMSILKAAAFIFIPTAILTAAYICAGYMQTAIPSMLIFFLLALIFLFPFQIGVVLKASKKESGKYSLKSALSHE